MPVPEFVPWPPEARFVPVSSPERAARDFHDAMVLRRSVRHFSDRPVSRETIEWVVRTAASAPSGANKQPWRFVCVSDPTLKREIRKGAEAEEHEFYTRRASARWLADLEPIGTHEDKPFLEAAPWLIVVFKLAKDDDGGQVYYASESVGLAAGFLLAACQMAGLATLTHTPSPMAFLNAILGRPERERPFLLVPVGYATDDCTVPKAALAKKPLAQVCVFDREAGGA